MIDIARTFIGTIMKEACPVKLKVLLSLYELKFAGPFLLPHVTGTGQQGWEPTQRKSNAEIERFLIDVI